MRVELVGGAEDLALDVVLDAARLAGEAREEASAALELLSPLEVALVHDWAMREYLRASDHGTRRRPRPACLDLAILAVQLRGSPGVLPDVARVCDLLRGVSRGGWELDLESAGQSSAVGGERAVELGSGDSSSPGDDRSRWRVEVSVDLDLPPGSEPPTPTVEAVEAVVLAVAGPGYRIRPGPRVEVTRVDGVVDPEASAPGRRRGRSAVRQR